MLDFCYFAFLFLTIFNGFQTTKTPLQVEECNNNVWFLEYLDPEWKNEYQ